MTATLTCPVHETHVIGSGMVIEISFGKNLTTNPSDGILMDERTTVLVLGETDRSPVVDLLFNLGCVPFVKSEMIGALDKLRHEDIAAVVVDCDGLHTDVLEFVLNVRDIDHRVPVVVLNHVLNDGEVALLNEQKGISLVHSDSGVGEIVQHILRKNQEG